jgi:hypothetical protein
VVHTSVPILSVKISLVLLLLIMFSVVRPRDSLGLVH